MNGKIFVDLLPEVGNYSWWARGRQDPIKLSEWKGILTRAAHKPSKGYSRPVPDPLAESQVPIGWVPTFLR